MHSHQPLVLNQRPLAQVSNNGIDFSLSNVPLDVRAPAVLARVHPPAGSEGGGTPLEVHGSGFYASDEAPPPSPPPPLSY